VGSSNVETDLLDTAKELMKKAVDHHVAILLPTDVIVAPAIDFSAAATEVAVDKIPAAQKIADIGPATVAAFTKQLRASKTVFWNGPMGVVEMPQFAAGTEALANLLTTLDAATVVGGGSTAEVMDSLGLADKVTFVSTGGGASMEFLGGEALPGVTALLDKP
jgi:phosphoglycerate kinase